LSNAPTAALSEFRDGVIGSAVVELFIAIFLRHAAGDPRLKAQGKQRGRNRHGGFAHAALFARGKGFDACAGIGDKARQLTKRYGRDRMLFRFYPLLSLTKWRVGV
jgi:uncharacterized protein YfiM (DUF2279 family)